MGMAHRRQDTDFVHCVLNLRENECGLRAWVKPVVFFNVRSEPLASTSLKCLLSLAHRPFHLTYAPPNSRRGLSLEVASVLVLLNL